MALIEANMQWICFIIGGPVSSILIMTLLYQTVGKTALYGLALCSILIIFQMPINKIVLHLRLRIAESTDKRISLIKNLI